MNKVFSLVVFIAAILGSTLANANPQQLIKNKGYDLFFEEGCPNKDDKACIPRMP